MIDIPAEIANARNPENVAYGPVIWRTSGFVFTISFAADTRSPGIATISTIVVRIAMPTPTKPANVSVPTTALLPPFRTCRTI